MLPSGHIAAGYLVSLAAAKALQTSDPRLIAFGTFMAFAPDLDLFYKFSQVKRFYFDKDSDNAETTHRRLVTHAPLVYLLISLGLLVFSRELAVMFFVGSWSHFILDSSGYGIPWLYPFSKKLFSVMPINEETRSNGIGFIDYWVKFIKFYAKRPEFYLEILIIIIAVIVLI